jgi:prolyl-tRNA editing enzyme YbaK/EbsC (Cys-tRNA(Pro) deacylase)
MRASAGTSVGRVREALAAAGSPAEVVALEASARTAADAALACGVPVGAIVKSLVFEIGGRPVMALVAGDRRCDQSALAAALGIEGEVRRADARMVREATGFAIGGVAPIGHPRPLPTAVDASLGRFGLIFAAAGHPHCVFGTSLDELLRLTGGRLAEAIAIREALPPTGDPPFGRPRRD